MEGALFVFLFTGVSVPQSTVHWMNEWDQVEGEPWKGQGSYPQGKGYILRGPEGGRDVVRFAFYIQPGIW